MGKTSTKLEFLHSVRNLKVRKRSISALNCTFGSKQAKVKTQLNMCVKKKNFHVSCT